MTSADTSSAGGSPITHRMIIFTTPADARRVRLELARTRNEGDHISSTHKSLPVNTPALLSYYDALLAKVKSSCAEVEQQLTCAPPQQSDTPSPSKSSCFHHHCYCVDWTGGIYSSDTTASGNPGNDLAILDKALEKWRSHTTAAGQHPQKHLDGRASSSSAPCCAASFSPSLDELIVVVLTESDLADTTRTSAPPLPLLVSSDPFCFSSSATTVTDLGVVRVRGFPRSAACRCRRADADSQDTVTAQADSSEGGEEQQGEGGEGIMTKDRTERSGSTAAGTKGFPVWMSAEEIPSGPYKHQDIAVRFVSGAFIVHSLCYFKDWCEPEDFPFFSPPSLCVAQQRASLKDILSEAIKEALALPCKLDDSDGNSEEDERRIYTALAEMGTDASRKRNRTSDVRATESDDDLFNTDDSDKRMVPGNSSSSTPSVLHMRREEWQQFRRSGWRYFPRTATATTTLATRQCESAYITGLVRRVDCAYVREVLSSSCFSDQDSAQNTGAKMWLADATDSAALTSMDYHYRRPSALQVCEQYLRLMQRDCGDHNNRNDNAHFAATDASVVTNMARPRRVPVGYYQRCLNAIAFGESGEATASTAVRQQWTDLQGVPYFVRNNICFALEWQRAVVQVPNVPTSALDPDYDTKSDDTRDTSEVAELADLAQLVWAIHLPFWASSQEMPWPSTTSFSSLSAYSNDDLLPAMAFGLQDDAVGRHVASLVNAALSSLPTCKSSKTETKSDEVSTAEGGGENPAALDASADTEEERCAAHGEEDQKMTLPTVASAEEKLSCKVVLAVQGRRREALSLMQRVHCLTAFSDGPLRSSAERYSHQRQHQQCEGRKEECLKEYRDDGDPVVQLPGPALALVRRFWDRIARDVTRVDAVSQETGSADNGSTEEDMEEEEDAVGDAHEEAELDAACGGSAMNHDGATSGNGTTSQDNCVVHGEDEAAVKVKPQLTGLDALCLYMQAISQSGCATRAVVSGNCATMPINKDARQSEGTHNTADTLWVNHMLFLLSYGLCESSAAAGKSTRTAKSLADAPCHVDAGVPPSLSPPPLQTMRDVALLRALRANQLYLNEALAATYEVISMRWEAVLRNLDRV